VLCVLLLSCTRHSYYVAVPLSLLAAGSRYEQQHWQQPQQLATATIAAAAQNLLHHVHALPAQLNMLQRLVSRQM
jgi:hypothetical protein